MAAGHPPSHPCFGGVPMSIATAGEDLLGGLIADGTVSRSSARAPETLWNQRFAQRTQRITASMIRELLKLTEQPDIISFAGGRPPPEDFPTKEDRRAAEQGLRGDGGTALQYTTTEG